MTGQNYLKVEHVRTGLLSSSLARFQQFWSECLLLTFVEFNSYCLRGPNSIVKFWGNVFHSVVWSMLGLCFFRLKSSSCFFPWKPMFSKNPPFFVLFVYNIVALNLHLHVVALPASVTMSWATKTTKKLNMSGLDFLALVLQSSNSFDLNAFFQVLFCLILNVYEGLVQSTHSEYLFSTGFCWKVEIDISVFFCLKSLNCSPLKTHVFGKSFIFCTICL